MFPSLAVETNFLPLFRLLLIPGLVSSAHLQRSGTGQLLERQKKAEYIVNAASYSIAGFCMFDKISALDNDPYRTT